MPGSFSSWSHTFDCAGRPGTLSGSTLYSVIRIINGHVFLASGCKITWPLIEYAAKLDLPDEVFDHPDIRELEDMANDLIAWPNVSILHAKIYSFYLKTVIDRIFTHISKKSPTVNLHVPPERS